MTKRFLSLLLILTIPLYFGCKQDNTEEPQETPTGEETPTTPTTPEDEEEPPVEIKSGDVLLVTSELIEKFITEVSYPERDYSESKLSNYSPVSPGKADCPPVFTVRWKCDPSAGDQVTCTLTMDAINDLEAWTNTVTMDAGKDYNYWAKDDQNYWKVTNLMPNATYHYLVTGENGKELAKGDFTTEGHLHHLNFKSKVRNCRDLGGWKTETGQIVRHRMIYRGGRLQNPELNKNGIKEVQAEGIKAQLDLRGHSDVLSAPAIEGFDFCNPVIEEGYSQLLKDDQEKARQCFEFIAKCVHENKPVYFHCSLGRDRTGTIAMIVLGVLGVPEGEISKEYEITQFAPYGYSVSSGESIKMTRRVDYKGAANYIWENFAKKEDGTYDKFSVAMKKYLMHIGVDEGVIDQFREEMLWSIR